MRQKIAYIESDIYYYFGFGLIIYLPVYFSGKYSFFLSNGIWCLLFPMFIINSYKSNRKLKIDKNRKLKCFKYTNNIINFILEKIFKK